MDGATSPATKQGKEVACETLARIESCLQRPLAWVERAEAASASFGPGGPTLPLVLTGLRWPAHRLWTGEYVKRRVDPEGRATVEVSRSRSGRFPDFSFDAADEAEANPLTRLPFSSFVDHLLAPRSPGGEWLYLSGDAAHLRHNGREGGLFAPLLRDLHVPPQIDPQSLLTIGFWMGRKGTVAHLHFDRNGCHNINAQVRGTKLFILFPPSEYAKLYPPGGGGDDDDGSAQRRGLNLLRNMSQIDLKLIHEPHQRALFPAFAEVHGIKAILREGEMLVIPASWYHFVMCLDDFNINVNFWWKSSAAIPSALPEGFPTCEDDADPPKNPATPRPSRRL